MSHSRVWTAEEISSRLGISTAVFQQSDLEEKHIAEIREAGIERIEISCIPRCLDYHNPSSVQEIKRACESHGVRVVSVHGPLGLPYGNDDEVVRTELVRESLAAIRFAVEMDAPIYVAHFGYLDHGKKTVVELLEATDDLKIKLTTENQTRQPIERYAQVVDEIGSERFGVILDIGHPRDEDGVNPFVKEDKARRLIANLGRRLFHVHLHETFDLDKKPDHRPPMHAKGLIAWEEVFAGLKGAGYEGTLLFEDGRGEDLAEWVRHTADFPSKFEARYGE